MSFTVNECRVMQLERNNLNHSYTMLNIYVAVTTQERDLGVILYSPLKSLLQHGSSQKVSMMLGIIRNILTANQKALSCSYIKP